jgi:hypothetical protein
MKKRSLALWAVLFVALFAVLSGGCGGSSDINDSSDSGGGGGGGGDGGALYKEYEGTWKYVSDYEDDARESEITISSADGSDESFTAHLKGEYTKAGVTTDIAGEYTFTRVYAKDMPEEFWKEVWQVTFEIGQPIFDKALMFRFIKEDGSKGTVNFEFTEDGNNVVFTKDKIGLSFIQGEFDWVNQVYHFSGTYERQ